jgi:hypothetical protein
MNDTLENSFVKKSFFPFTVLEFKLSVSKDTKQNFAQALIIIVEIDQIPLVVSFPESALARKVNTNDKL